MEAFPLSNNTLPPIRLLSSASVTATPPLILPFPNVQFPSTVAGVSSPPLPFGPDLGLPTLLTANDSVFLPLQLLENLRLPLDQLLSLLPDSLARLVGDSVASLVALIHPLSSLAARTHAETSLLQSFDLFELQLSSHSVHPFEHPSLGNRLESLLRNLLQPGLDRFAAGDLDLRLMASTSKGDLAALAHTSLSSVQNARELNLIGQAIASAKSENIQKSAHNPSRLPLDERRTPYDDPRKPNPRTGHGRSRALVERLKQMLRRALSMLQELFKVRE